MRLILILLLSLLACERQDNVAMYRAEIPFTYGSKQIDLHIFNNNFILCEYIDPGTVSDIIPRKLIQLGEVFDGYIKDTISGEVYYFIKADNYIRFQNGRYAGLIFDDLKINYGDRDLFLEQESSFFKRTNRSAKKHIEEFNLLSQNIQFKLSLLDEAIFSNYSKNLRLILSPDSTYSYFHYEYLIDYGKFKTLGNLITFYPEPYIDQDLEEDEFFTILKANSKLKYKSVIINDSLLAPGTLPYGISEDYLKVN